MDLVCSLKDHTSVLGPINQKPSILHCSFAASFNICCSCCKLYWLLGHEVKFLIPSLLVISYSVHMKQLMASCILLCFPSRSCFLLCNVIIILLQSIILHHCIIFVINSSCCFSLSLDMLCRAQGLLCSVQESTWEIKIQIWQQTSPGLGREDGMAMVLITDSWAHQLFLWCLYYSVGVRKWRCRQCADAFDTVWFWKRENTVVPPEPDVKVMQRKLMAVVENFLITWENWLEVAVLSLSERFKKKMSLHILRRWGDGEEEWDACKSTNGCFFTLK